MNEVLLTWLVRQTEQTHDNEPCTAFRLSHTTATERTVLVERFTLSAFENDPTAVYANLHVVANNHAEAFPGMPQRYLVQACYGEKQTPHAVFPWRICAQGTQSLTLGNEASESATQHGIIAQLMRHQEIFVRSKVEHDGAAIKALREHSDSLKEENENLRKLNRDLREKLDEAGDRKLEREHQTLLLREEVSRPQREAHAKAIRYKPVIDMAATAIGPALQTWAHKTLGIGVPDSLHPIMAKLANAYEQAKGLSAEDFSAMVQALPPNKVQLAIALFDAVKDAAAAYEQIKQNAQAQNTQAQHEQTVQTSTEGPAL